jgi:hypothetical protein
VYQDYIDETYNFARTAPVEYGDITILPSQVVRRELVIAIPPHSATGAQREVLDALVEYGRTRNVVVRIVELR